MPIIQLIVLLKSHMHLVQYGNFQVCIRCSSVKVTLCPLTSSVDGVRTCTTPSTHISVDLVIVLVTTVTTRYSRHPKMHAKANTDTRERTRASEQREHARYLSYFCCAVRSE